MTNKRLLKEINRLILNQNLKQDILDNDYLIHYDESNFNTVYTIIKGPYDSVYRHKFIRLNFNIPSNYPHSPPKVTFINYDGVRIHPNMYQDGKCCSTILNTWPSENEKWTSSMGIETILLTFLSFLDNDPYKYEPGGRNDTTYTDYVLYQSWKTCLLRYINDEMLFSNYITNYLLKNVDNIFNDLYYLYNQYPLNFYETKCFEINLYKIDYFSIIMKIENVYRSISFKKIQETIPDLKDIDTNFDNFNCNICFDTNLYNDNIVLSCTHKFHKICLRKHIKENGDICSLCRKKLSNLDKQLIALPTFVLNPQTNRKIKVGGKLYKQLIKDEIIDKIT